MTQSLFAAEGDTSEYVTTATNDTGNFSPVLEISPDDGVEIPDPNDPSTSIVFAVAESGLGQI